ncbi:MAG: PHP domain-containing protein [Candidatus Lokiarchaeota archaeon]|nr:PHP domain-containing protein [Candidatus Lokiarchaeota archaeon]
MDRADLHIHSTFSDGKLTPSKIVRVAEAKGLGAIALTDHDTLNGIPEFIHAESKSNLLRIPGVEISTEYKNQRFHLLGYYPPLDSKPVINALERLERSRKERIPKMCEKLEELGIGISKEDVVAIANIASPGRPHVGRALVKIGAVDTVQEAFDKYLGRGKPAYVEKERMNTIETIKLLRREHSIPVLAHPLLEKVQNLEQILLRFKQAGLIGVELGYKYGKHESWRDLQNLESIATRLGLILTGGSDSHGDSSHSPIGGITVSIRIANIIQQIHEEGY